MPARSVLSTLLVLLLVPALFAQDALSTDPAGAATEAFAEGRALEDAGEIGAAYEQYRLAYELDPGHYRALYRAGRLLREMGKRQNAHAALRRAVAVAPGFYPAYNHLGLLLIERGDLAGAIEAYRGGTEAAPDLAQAWRNLARALAEAGQVDEAIAAYERALALEPNHAASLAALAELYAMQGNDEAAADLRAQVGSAGDGGNDPAGLEGTGDNPVDALPPGSAGRGDMPSGTITDTGTPPVGGTRYPYPPLDVTNPVHLREAGIAHVRSGQWAAGIEALVAALRYGGPDPITFAELAYARHQIGDYAGAAWAWGEAAELGGPTRAGHLLNEALALRAAGDPAGARNALKRALAIQPAFAHAHYLLGTLAMEENDLSSAIRQFRAAVQADPAHIGAHLALAAAYETRGQDDEAVRLLRLTLRLHPGDPDALAALGRVLERRRQPGEALDAYEALLVVTSGDPDHADLNQLARTKVSELAYAATLDAPSITAGSLSGDLLPAFVRDLDSRTTPGDEGPPFARPDANRD